MDRTVAGGWRGGERGIAGVAGDIVLRTSEAALECLFRYLGKSMDTPLGIDNNAWGYQEDAAEDDMGMLVGKAWRGVIVGKVTVATALCAAAGPLFLGSLLYGVAILSNIPDSAWATMLKGGARSPGAPGFWEFFHAVVSDGEETKIRMMHAGLLNTNKGVLIGVGRLGVEVTALGAMENQQLENSW